MNKFLAITFAAALSLLGMVGTAALAETAPTAVVSPVPTAASDDGRILAKEDLEKLFVAGSEIRYAEGAPGTIMVIRLRPSGVAESDYESRAGAQTTAGSWRIDSQGVLCRTFWNNHNGFETCSGVSDLGNNSYRERRTGRRFQVVGPKVAATAK